MQQAPFDRFSPSAYLREHYRDLTRDTKFILRFLHEAYRTVDKRHAHILEVGGGATIYQLLSAGLLAPQITFTDMLEVNLKEVNRWLQKKPGAFSWRAYVQYVARLEGKSEQMIEARLRRSIVALLQLNILEPDAGWRTQQGTFDIVSAHFCPESITRDRAEYRRAFGNVVSFVKPRGALVMSFLKDAHSYHAGRQLFPAYSIVEDDVRTFLGRHKFSFIEIQSIDLTQGKNHNTLMCALAIRGNRTSTV